jgi:hypothetical protein
MCLTLDCQSFSRLQGVSYLGLQGRLGPTEMFLNFILEEEVHLYSGVGILHGNLQAGRYGLHSTRQAIPWVQVNLKLHLAMVSLKVDGDERMW